MDQLSSPSSPSDRDDLIDTGPDFSNPLTHPFSNTLYPFQSQSPFSHDNNIGGISNGNGHHHAGNGWQGNLGGKMGESSGSGFMGAGIDLTSGTTTGEILQPYAQMFTHNPHQHPQSSQPSHLNSSANNIRHSHTHHAQPHHPHLPSNYTHNQTHTHQSHTHTPNNVDLDDDDILATSIGSGQGVDDDLEAILPPAAMARFRTSFDSGSGTGTVNTAELTGRGTPGMYGSMTGFSNQQDQQMNPNISQQHPHASHPNYAQQQQNQQQQQPPSVPATQPSSALSEEKARALESLLVKFWTRQMDLAERGTTSSSVPGNGAPSAVKDQEFKNFALPLARIKKVMKSDPDVKMISAEVPVLLGKCCESESNPLGVTRNTCTDSLSSFLRISLYCGTDLPSMARSPIE
jgi:hypothetical protein